ncbi:MAG: CDP-alcohol phosphatidyltransferase family protein [Anaerolineae bacterium]|nr:CDP-alcohol phosphatidyltransferase family protein [Anaerolineae bacterium]
MGPMAREPGSQDLREALRARTKGLLESIVRPLARAGISPNILTVVGFLAMVGVAWVLSQGYERLAGLLIIAVGLFDALDGALARSTGKSTTFGAFFDSTLDRFAEIALYLGLLYLYRGDTLATVLIYLTITGSLMVSYTRARAEGLGVECKVGLFTRLERLAVLVLGLLLHRTLLALVVLAVLSNLTALQRMWHIWRVAGRDQA